MADFNWQSRHTYQQFVGPAGGPFAAQPTANRGYYGLFLEFSSQPDPVTQVNTLAKIDSIMSLDVVAMWVEE